MSDNDLQASLAVRLGQSLANMMRFEDGLGGIRRKMREVGSGADDMQKKIKQKLLEQREHIKEVSSAWTTFGYIMRSMGGEAGRLGSVLGRGVGRGVSLGGSLGVVTIGLVGAAVATRAFIEWADKATARTRRFAEEAERLGQALIEGQKGRGRMGEAGAKQLDNSTREAVAFGGDIALNNIDDLVEKGMDRKDAAKVIAQSQRIKDGAARYHAIRAATTFFQAGGDPSKAMEEIVKHKSLQNMLKKRDGDGEGLDVQADRVVTKLLKQEGHKDINLAKIRDNLSKSKFVKEVDGAAKDEYLKDKKERDYVTDGTYRKYKDEELADSLDPLKTAIDRETSKREKEIEILTLLTHQQNKLAAAFHFYASFLGGEDSEQQKLQDAITLDYKLKHEGTPLKPHGKGK